MPSEEAADIARRVAGLTDEDDVQHVIQSAQERLIDIRHNGPAGPMTKKAAGYKPIEEVSSQGGRKSP